MNSEQLHLITNTGAEPFFCVYSSKTYIFNPNPKLNPSTWGFVPSEEYGTVTLLTGRTVKHQLPPKFVKLSDKPGPHRHYVPASMLPVIYSGQHMGNNPPPFQNAHKLIKDLQAIEQAEAQITIYQEQTAIAKTKLDELQAKIAALEAKTNASGETDKLLKQDGIKVPTDKTLR